MTRHEILAIIQRLPGCKMSDVLSELGISPVDRDSEQTVGGIMGQLFEHGLINQERGGWYVPPDSFAGAQAARRQAAADARAERSREMAAVRAQADQERRIAAVVARAKQRVQTLEETRVERAEKAVLNRERFFVLAKQLTLRQIADICARSVSAAQQWREGRSPVPDYAINALEAFNAPRSETVITDLIGI